jgi:hypothetical protein
MFVGAIGGFATFGTTGMLVATTASGFMMVSCFLFISPVQVEMMELGRALNVRPKDIGAGLTLGLLGGLFIGGFVVLCWAYGLGADNLKTGWPYNQNWYYTTYRQGELSADRVLDVKTHSLKPTPETKPLNFSRNTSAKGLAIGFVITCVLAFLRSTFMWFPLHPLGYVMATTYLSRTCWFMFFIAWAVRSIILRIGGAHTIRKGLVPFAIGAFIACMASIVIFDLVGIYMRSTGVVDIYCAWP